jgi:hypothetical protein
MELPTSATHKERLWPTKVKFTQHSGCCPDTDLLNYKSSPLIKYSKYTSIHSDERKSQAPLIQLDGPDSFLHGLHRPNPPDRIVLKVDGSVCATAPSMRRSVCCMLITSRPREFQRNARIKQESTCRDYYPQPRSHAIISEEINPPRT